MANVVYTSGITRWDEISDTATPQLTVGVALVTSTYTADKDHTTMADIVSHEIQDYSATPIYERQYLTNVEADIDVTNNWIKYTADSVVWVALDNTDVVDGIVLYIEDESATPSDSGRDLLAFYDISAVAPNGTDFTINWSVIYGLGIFRQG
jgi:hypothetical protein